MRLRLPERLFDQVDRRWFRAPRRHGKPRKRAVALRRIACEKGAPVYSIGSGERGAEPTFEEPQDGQTIEIGATVQGGVPPSP
jgi:hypothetical protein